MTEGLVENMFNDTPGTSVVGRTREEFESLEESAWWMHEAPGTLHRHTYTYTYIHIHVYIYIYIYICIYICIYIYMYIHVQIKEVTTRWTRAIPYAHVPFIMPCPGLQTRLYELQNEVYGAVGLTRLLRR